MKDRGPIDITTLFFEPAKPHSEWRFDPRRDIEEEFWENLLGSFREQKEIILKEPLRPSTQSAFTDAVKNAAMLALLSPQRIPQLGLNDIPERKVRLHLEQIRRDRERFDFYNLLLFTKIGFGITPRESPPARETRQNLLRRLAKNLQGVTEAELYVQIALATTVAKLDGVNELELDEEKWQDLFETLKFTNEPTLWAGFTNMAAGLKILYPQKVDQIEQEVERFGYSRLREIAQQHLTRDPFVQHVDMREFYIHLGILTAQKVTITDRGLELVWPQPPFTQEVPPMPPMRKF